MPAKRRVLDRRRTPPISDEAMRLWTLCREIEREHGRVVETWEPKGRRREFLEAEKRLCIELGLDWCSGWSPINAKTEAAPRYLAANSLLLADHRRAYAARQRLLAADREAAAE